jgi:methyl-accepting chemotaxis protein
MKLGTRIVAIAIGSMFLTTFAGLLVQRSVIQQQGIDSTRATMRSMLLGAENTRQSISALRTAQVYNDEKLIAELKTKSDYRQASIYATVPVVAAWNSIRSVATKEGYDFRVPAHNARNPQNQPMGDEERILTMLESQKLPEYFAVDKDKNEIVYARPIALTADCLMCHGDPSTSKTGDGKDLLGFRMENWKAGDPHGMFLLRTKMDRVDTVVQKGMLETLYWLLPLAVLVGFGVYWIISRITERLRTLTESLATAAAEVNSASSQIASQSHSLAQGASEQAASLEETSASSEEINSMARKNTDNSRETAQLLTRSHEKVIQANHHLDQMVVSMDHINESSNKISKIIKVIDEIAFQTNILALNAAVEAARAGEAGMGFAVVADEVRSLAQRSAQAAKDTATLIEDSIAKSGEGKAKVDQVALAIQAVTEDSARVKVMVDEVSLGSEEQSRGIDQIGRSIAQMEQVTQTSAASAEESAAAAEELSAQSEMLKDILGELQELVEGVGAGKASTKRRLTPPAPSSSAAKARSQFTQPVRVPARPQFTATYRSKVNTAGVPVKKTTDEFPMEESFKSF